MNKLNFIILSIFLIGLSQLALAGEKKVSLSQVSSTLASFENSENDYIKDSIVYREAGKANYDNFFKESAILYATLVQLTNTKQQMKDGKVDKESAFGVATLAVIAEKTVTLEKDLNRLNGLAGSLNPNNDFKGMDKRKLPEATKGMTIATKQLGGATKLLALLLEGN